MSLYSTITRASIIDSAVHRKSPRLSASAVEKTDSTFGFNCGDSPLSPLRELMLQTGPDTLHSEIIDAEYDPSRRVFSRQPYMDWYVRESVRARTKLGGRLDISFGPTPAETLDIFPSAKPNSPVFMFIHGGYWRALSSKEFSYVAAGLVPHDITVVVMNYALCPDVSIPDITAQSRAAVAWLTRNAQQYGGNPAHIVVGGHSAGGQQVGMLLSGHQLLSVTSCRRSSAGGEEALTTQSSRAALPSAACSIFGRCNSHGCSRHSS